MSRTTLKFSLGLLLGASCLQALGKTDLPPDLVRFIERRDGCEHFRGEEPYDEERRQFLVAKMNEFCTGTDEQLARLTKKYGANTRVMEKLNEYETQIEADPPK